MSLIKKVVLIKSLIFVIMTISKVNTSLYFSSVTTIISAKELIIYYATYQIAYKLNNQTVVIIIIIDRTMSLWIIA